LSPLVKAEVGEEEDEEIKDENGE